MHVDAREPVVANEISLCDVLNMFPRLWIQVCFGEPEIDHVYYMFVRWEANDAVTELNIAMQYPSRVHKLEPRDLVHHAKYQNVSSTHTDRKDAK
jgi:hypothetical protein